MAQLNLKHLYDGELTPLDLGNMSISAALYTGYNLQMTDEFTLVTFHMDNNDFALTNILGSPVFFHFEVSSGNLDLISNIEEALEKAAEAQGENRCRVYVHKDLIDFNTDITEVSAKINNTDVFDDFFEQVIEDYREPEFKVEYKLNEDFEENEELDRIEIQFKHIEAFDDITELYLDVDNEVVSDLLDDVMDLDAEIGVLKEMAQNMLEEANYISKNGHASEDDEYSWDEDMYLETTLEEDEELGITEESFYYDSRLKNVEDEVDKMNSKENNAPTPEFTERLDNMLEYMLTQSSIGHDPEYKYNYTSKGGKLPRHKDKYGEFKVDFMDNYTKMKADDYVIELQVKREEQETGEVTTTIEESELTSDFTLDEVLNEVNVNNKVMKDVDVTLYSVKRRNGEVVWVAKNK